MGLFGDLLGGLFGGGSETVVTSQQDVNVEVGILNEINTDGLTNVLESIKTIFEKETEEQTQLQKITAVILASGAKAEQEKAAALGSLAGVSKIALLTGGGYLLYRHQKKKRRKK